MIPACPFRRGEAPTHATTRARDRRFRVVLAYTRFRRDAAGAWKIDGALSASDQGEED